MSWHVPIAPACAGCTAEDVNGESVTLMVPYADLANHSFDNNATFCFSKDNRR